MFPGYLLVEPPLLVDQRLELYHLASTAGVREFLRFDGKLAIVPQAAMIAIRSEEQANHPEAVEIASGKRKLSFKIGETVRVKDGAFAAFLADIASLDDAGRVTVLLSLFGRQTKTQLDGEAIERL